MEKKRVALLAIFSGIVIFGIKLVAYFISDSVALLSDALESVVNILLTLLPLITDSKALPSLRVRLGMKR